MHTFTLLQWKYAIKLESLGMRHSSRRSVRTHASRVLECKPAEVEQKIEDLLREARERVAP